MTQWTQQLLWHSLAMSCVVLAYYAATASLRKRYATKWFYLLGVILLVGFLIPFRPVITVEMERMPAFMQAAVTQEASGQAAVQIMPGPLSQTGQGSPWTIAFFVWAFGALATLAYHGIKHLRFVRAVRRWYVPVTDARLLARFEEAKRSLGLEGRDIGFGLCACVHSPMLLQLERPTVVLPEGGWTAYDPRFILLHELVHYKRKDLLCKRIMLLSMAIHWFNPAIYLLVRLVTVQCEISCDERVVEGQDIEGRHQYAMSIINVARCHSKGYTLLTTYFNGGKTTMKKRISSVYEPAKARVGALLLVFTLLMTLLAGTSIAADPSEFTYTLPEAPIRLDEKVDAYVVSWAPMDGIKEYHVGAYYSLRIEETSFRNPLTDEMSEPTDELWIMTGGWVGANKIKDGAGKEYDVEMGIWESVTLPGDATEVDIGELINKQLEPIEIDPDATPVEYAKKEALLSFTMVITAVPESGEPIVTSVELPVA
ncbi:M56 family metallopeptidase [Eubacteriales bacterium OttesenSCG-928-A19]|nr:M56 family metallopeptidase [Eubacteriales bacterium OttesenSCG-928-A19]